MHDVTFRTNIDAAKRLLSKFNDGLRLQPALDGGPANHADFNPLVGDIVVIHRSYYDGKIIQMIVVRRTWNVTPMATELEIELTTPPGMSITQFTDHVRECGLPVNP